ncbi:MAG: hypothetical protein V3U35_08140, partial [Candidatus Neomarinimicrobiota bacterium]
QLLQANPLHRGALERLNRIRAEQEMLDEVQAELRVKEGGVPKGAGRSGADRARSAAGKAAPAGLPETGAAELAWKANIKRVAAAAAMGGSEGADPSAPVKTAEPDSPGLDVARVDGPQQAATASPHGSPGPENDPDPLPDTLPEALKTAFLPIDEGSRGGETEDEGPRDAGPRDPFQARASEASWAGGFLGERLETETPPETGVAVAPAIGAGEWMSPDTGAAPQPEVAEGTVMVAERSLDDSEPEAPAFEPGETTLPMTSDQPGEEPNSSDPDTAVQEELPYRPEDWNPGESVEDGQEQEDEATSDTTEPEGYADRLAGETPGDRTAQAEGIEDRAADPPSESPFQPGESTDPADADTLPEEPTLTDAAEIRRGDGPSAPEDVSAERSNEGGQEFMEGTASDATETEDDPRKEGEAAGPTDSENGEDLEAVAADQAVTDPFQPGEAAAPEAGDLREMPAPSEAADEEALAGPDPIAAMTDTDPDSDEMVMDEQETEPPDLDEAATEAGDAPAALPESDEAPHGEDENSTEAEESPFQPGAATAKGEEGPPHGLEVDTGTAEREAVEVDTFTPGEPTEGAGTLDQMETEPTVEAGALPGAEKGERTEALPTGESADDLPYRADATDAFEVGQDSSMQTGPGVDEERADGGGTDVEENLPGGPQEGKDAPTLDKTALESKDLADEPTHEGLTADADSADEGATGESRVAAEDKDMQVEPFEPGDMGAASEEGAPEAKAGKENEGEADGQEGEPYRPDVDSVEKAAHRERDELDKAAHAGGDMPGERFDPVQTEPSAGVEEGIDDTEPPKPEPPGARPQDEAAVSNDTLQIDPHLATFTLATIYKVQGLYRQALQVLDMLEAKDADTERIQAERESIQQLMISDSPSG